MGNPKNRGNKVYRGIEMSDALKLLRYNTGTDKKVFVKFKNDFDAVIFNSTILAYSGSAITDIVSIHKNKYIIDPQTHIFQHDISTISTRNKKGEINIKASVTKYFDKISCKLTQIIESEKRSVTISEAQENQEELVDKVYEFQTSYINQFLDKKEYSKYLKFTNNFPTPKLIIAPYFMLKNEYSNEELNEWLKLNKDMIIKFYNLNNDKEEIAAQIVLDKKVLTNSSIINFIKETYRDTPCSYIFIWISDFNSFDATKEQREAFYKLLEVFKKIDKKPIMTYGGYDAIFLCNKDITNRLYGVAQSVGYGEKREITPVGGGMPVNKYYFYPLHMRLRFGDASQILLDSGYFSNQKSNSDDTKDYYKNICDCKMCKDTIKQDINNFNLYNASKAYEMKSKNDVGIQRLRPTTEASYIAAMHFLGCKKKEWDFINNQPLEDIKKSLLENYNLYEQILYSSIKEWCDLYAR